MFDPSNAFGSVVPPVGIQSHCQWTFCLNPVYYNQLPSPFPGKQVTAIATVQIWKIKTVPLSSPRLTSYKLKCKWTHLLPSEIIFIYWLFRRSVIKKTHNGDVTTAEYLVFLRESQAKVLTNQSTLLQFYDFKTKANDRVASPSPLPSKERLFLLA